MPEGLEGEKRLPGTIAAAAHVMQIAAVMSRWPPANSEVMCCPIDADEHLVQVPGPAGMGL